MLAFIEQAAEACDGCCCPDANSNPAFAYLTFALLGLLIVFMILGIWREGRK